MPRNVVRLLVVAVTAVNCLASQVARDAKLSPPELIQAYGYPAESHEVQTEDGYILTMHRIPHGLQSDAIGKPAFLSHGTLESSADFLVTGPDHALAYYLADEGYDVWLANFRGNTYSRKHVEYSTSSKEFWNFSWHEQGVYDLPAMIDYVLETTNSSQLHLASHSQGSTTYYVLMSSRPEYNSKIKVACTMAPLAFMNHLFNPFVRATAWTYRIDEYAADTLHIYSLLPNNKIQDFALRELCQDHVPTQELCPIPIYLFGGIDPKQMNKTLLPIIFSYYPAGASVKQFLHYFQEVYSGHFRQWDYGQSKNKEVYGTPEPPDYDISQITAPLAIFYSENDWLNSPIDAKRLHDGVSNAIRYVRVPFDKWSHFDYIWGIEARSLVYQTIMEIFADYE